VFAIFVSGRLEILSTFSIAEKEGWILTPRLVRGDRESSSSKYKFFIPALELPPVRVHSVVLLRDWCGMESDENL
jgi:hypothetical protein